MYKRQNKNHEQLSDGTVKTWEHFYLELPSKFVDKSQRSVGDLKGPFRDTKNVFKRSLEEITDDAVDTVLELIGQKSLYKGEEWQHALEEFKKYKAMYAATPEELRDNFTWELLCSSPRWGPGLSAWKLGRGTEQRLSTPGSGHGHL